MTSWAITKPERAMANAIYITGKKRSLANYKNSNIDALDSPIEHPRRVPMTVSATLPTRISQDLNKKVCT